MAEVYLTKAVEIARENAISLEELTEVLKVLYE